jgi:hypothetical protein
LIRDDQSREDTATVKPVRQYGINLVI